MSRDASVRVRFAPSPTGHLHIGGLRTALSNWLFARHNGGTFIVRIEDTDRERSQYEYEQAIIQGLAWCGIESNEPLVRQSDRNDRYVNMLQTLEQNGNVYRCFCTESELRQRGCYNEFGMHYDGYCRTHDQERDAPFVLRFKVPDELTKIEFDDRIRGTISVSRDLIDDFICARTDGSPVYNFVVVIDDADMKITHVIRGEDHISNTPKQILLYQACGFDLPEFAHLPMILGSSGQRLSKRDAATSVFEYREQGYLPEALLNYLARLGWSHGDQEVFSLQELIELFSLEAIGKKGAIFDTEKLTWLNGVYIKKTDPAVLADLIKELNSEAYARISFSHDQLIALCILYSSRVNTVTDLLHVISRLTVAPQAWDTHDIQKWTSEQTVSQISTVVEVIAQVAPWKRDVLADALKAYMRSHGLKMPVIAQPIRLALTGGADSPGVFDLVSVLGKEESIVRLQAFVRFLDQSHK